MRIRSPKSLAFLILLAAPLAAQDDPKPLLEGLPVREVTIFKDGSAWVEHRGAVKPSAPNQVVLEQLPSPYLGTFWVSTTAAGAKVTSVLASNRDTTKPMPANQIHELLLANVGKKVSWVEYYGTGDKAEVKEFSGTILPRQEKEQAYILVQLGGGGVVPFDEQRAAGVQFAEAPDTKFPQPTKTASLTVTTEGAAADSELSVSYVQEGLRWVPSYRVTVGDDGKATILLQATIVNDLTDLADVNANLVIGVPTFAFKGEVDPIALQKTITETAQVAQSPYGRRAGMASLSNAVMSQVARFDGNESDDQAPQPTVTSAEKNEDLFVFTLDHLTLKRGERIVVPLGEYKVPVETVFKLAIPFGPPPGMAPQNGDPSQLDEIQRALAAPHAKSYLRLKNESSVPFTTAPALILKGDRILAQGMMKYTPINGRADLEANTAVDIRSRKRDREVARIPNALKINGTELGQVDVEGAIELENLRGTPVSIEVRREVLGKIKDAEGGTVTQLTGEWDEDVVTVERPMWWNWYSWPWWYMMANQLGTATWNVKLEPGEKKELHYTWSYYWGN